MHDKLPPVITYKAIREFRNRDNPRKRYPKRVKVIRHRRRRIHHQQKVKDLFRLVRRHFQRTIRKYEKVFHGRDFYVELYELVALQPLWIRVMVANTALEIVTHGIGELGTSHLQTPHTLCDMVWVCRERTITMNGLNKLYGLGDSYECQWGNVRRSLLKGAPCDVEAQVAAVFEPLWSYVCTDIRSRITPDG